MTRIVLNPLELRQTAALLDAGEQELERYAADFRHPPRPELTPAIAGAVEGGLRRAAHDCELLALQLEKEAQGLKRRAARVEVDLARSWQGGRLRSCRPGWPGGKSPAYYARYNRPLEEDDTLFLLMPGGLVRGGAVRAARAGGGLARHAGRGLKAIGGAIGGLFGRKPEKLRRLERGQKFDTKRASIYEHNQVYLHKADGSRGYWKLDSYSPGRGEIVSRKHTQLAAIKETTAIGYLRQFARKYPPLARVAEVPSTPPSLRGQLLKGRMFLEVPAQKRPIPPRVLEEARRLGIRIRDVRGKVYR